MGVTHNKEATFARLADVVGFVAPEHAVDVVKAIVTVHRDFGDRTDRKHARLKYVLHEWGLEKFRQELQSRVPFPIEPPQADAGLRSGRPSRLERSRARTRGVSACRSTAAASPTSAIERLRTGIREVVSRFGTRCPPDRAAEHAPRRTSGPRIAKRSKPCSTPTASSPSDGSAACGATAWPARRCRRAAWRITEAERVLPRVLARHRAGARGGRPAGSADRVPHDRLPERLRAAVRGRGRAGRTLARQVHALPRRRRGGHAPGAAVPGPRATRLGRAAR